MKHFVLLFMFSFFVVFSQNSYAKTEQSLSEYKIEQLQKNIDEIKKEIDDLKKDVDDTKEKKIENKATNESLDKRIGDINFNITTFAIFITVLLLGFGFFGYRNAKADAKKEAEDTTKNWLEKDGKKELDKIIQELQTKSEKEFNQLVNEKTVELNTLFENFKQEHKEQLHNHENEFKQKMKEHYTVEEKEKIEKEAKISQEKTIKTFDDYWNIIIQHYANKKYGEMLSIISKTEKLENLTNRQRGPLYLVKGLSYHNLKDYEKAEEYYLKAIDTGNNDALFNLGLLYDIKKDVIKAEEYYLKAIEEDNNEALNNLAYLYFSKSKNKEKALELAQKSYDTNKVYINTHTFANVLLWNEEFSKSYEKFEECIEYDEVAENLQDISEYINLLISKGQYYKAKEYFENEKYQLKDRLKPIWYALMTLMQNENEIKKMGSELQTSVNDILKTIEELKIKYKI